MEEMNDLPVKEWIKEYPDLIVDVYTEGRNTVLVIPHGRVKILARPIKRKNKK